MEPRPIKVLHYIDLFNIMDWKNNELEKIL